MKRKMATLRYLLYGILFLPAAYVLCGVTSLPFWQAAVHFRNEGMLTVITVIGFFMIGVSFTLPEWAMAIDSSDADLNAGLTPLENIAVYTSSILATQWTICLFWLGPVRSSSAFYIALLLPFAGRFVARRICGMSEDALEDGVNGAWIPGLALSLMLSGILNLAYLYLLLLLDTSPGEEELFAQIRFSVAERLDAFAALGGLVMFAVLTRLDYHKRLLDLCQYPSDRRVLRREAETSREWERRLKALKLLPYPQEREILEGIARNDEEALVRKAALKRLPYPEEREPIAWIAKNDKEEDVRKAALNLLPYPQEREILLQIALYDKEEDVRKAALNRLLYPEEREILVQITLNDNAWYIRQAAVKLLPYPQEQEILEGIALKDPEQYVRRKAVELLPYPQV